MPSPIAFNRSLATPSMFAKSKKPPNVDLTSAASYLAAVSEMDAARQRNNSSAASLSSSTRSGTPTPALSMSSTLTSTTDTSSGTQGQGVCGYDDILMYDDNADGLGLPPTPPTSEQVFTTVHSEFGHCANETYRYESRARPGDSYQPHEPEPPYRILLATYISYILLICVGHLRDFFAKHLRSANYKHLQERDVRAFFPFSFSFSSFVTSTTRLL